MNRIADEMKPAPARIRLDDQLCFALYAATNSITRAYRPLLAEIGLTFPQYLVMLVLWQNGPRTIGDIAKRLQLPASAISPLADQVERRGFARRTRASDDRRVVRLHLTAAGKALERSVASAQRKVACMTGLGEEEITAMRAALHALADRVTAEFGTAREAEPAAGDGGLALKHG
ncbi:MAG TPA: MarR family transcriptional regulator [Gammaproteobacteria bacterium]